MAIHQEELQSDCGRIEGQHLSVCMGWALGTCSGIQGVPVGDNPAGRRLKPAGELQKDADQ